MKSVEIVITKKFVYTIDNLQNNEAWDIVNRQDDTITWAEEIERDSEPVEIETTWVEANYIDDFRNQNRIILGGPRPATTAVKQFYIKIFPKATIVKTGSTYAEMVKYFANTFLATKVSFANEMKIICEKLEIDYDKVVEYAIYDNRLGKSHWAVPGPDGKPGFGGSCFPKDINALVKLCEKYDFHPNVLVGAIETNLDVRPEEDWKELKGRAVTDE